MERTVTKRGLDELASDKPRIKYRRANLLIALAERDPEKLYPHLTFFVKLLESDNNILKWTAIDIVGHLSTLAPNARAGRLLERLAALLNTGKMITANHAISALSRIAEAKPAFRRRITSALLKVEHYTYDTEECRNIALGKVVQAFASFVKEPGQESGVLDFVKRQTDNSRPATRKKAFRLLRTFEVNKRLDGFPWQKSGDSF